MADYRSLVTILVSLRLSRHRHAVMVVVASFAVTIIGRNITKYFASPGGAAVPVEIAGQFHGHKGEFTGTETVFSTSRTVIARRTVIPPVKCPRSPFSFTTFIFSAPFSCNFSGWRPREDFFFFFVCFLVFVVLHHEWKSKARFLTVLEFVSEIRFVRERKRKISIDIVRFNRVVLIERKPCLDCAALSS